MVWTIDDAPDLTGQTALVTGANAGLGFYTTIGLAAAGAHVLMGARDPDRGAHALEAARGEVAARVSGRSDSGHDEPSIELVSVDLDSLSAVRDAATEIAERVQTLDLLVNNAGIMATPFERTVDGFERQLGVNHLAPFALTGLLWPLLERAEHPRVVGVSSVMHRRGRVRLDDLNYERRRYRPWEAYGQSKLANLLYALELNRRAKISASPVIAVTAHPGVAATNLFTGPTLLRSRVGQVGTSAFFRMFGHGPAAGAASLLYAATMPEVEPDAFLGPGGPSGMRGEPAPAGRSDRARDGALASRLWESSEVLTDVRYPPAPA